MKIAIDLDGTITANRKIGDFGVALRKSGFDVVVLTAAAGELPKELRLKEVRRRLDAMGFNDLLAVCVESYEKPEWCLKNGVDILIDDTEFELKGTVQLVPLK